MTTSTPGIPTLYRGIQYRSRLEARWAAFFEGLGWQTTYEPFDGDGYIPDFLVHTTEPFLTEIKPATTEADYRTRWPKINDGLIDHWPSGVFVGGVTPLPTCFWQCQCPEIHPIVAGAMSQRKKTERGRTRFRLRGIGCRPTASRLRRWRAGSPRRFWSVLDSEPGQTLALLGRRLSCR